jgi:hypothetical protein
MYSNHLAHEKSPYLIQHVHNPVDWYSWGDEAFAKAAKEDKPIFLSIGYSTCHWCHVMAHESFEEEATAKILNEHFISIKVDREERPDIDQVYMSYVMAATGSGGWPMTVFMTPDKKPFYGGTYFPPEDKYGRPGFKTLLLALNNSWKEKRSEIEESANSAVQFMQKAEASDGEPTPLTDDLLKEAAARYDRGYDEEYAGFGRSPKFPRSHVLSFILRVWKRTQEPKLLEIVEKTLDAMARGGMYDQLGGGFHRYSVDPQWRIPHFEKMLYDQAILVESYLEAYQITQKKVYADTARETLDYVLSKMTDKEGGFYSAEDADSLDPVTKDHKREGAFYVWRKEEIEKVLPAQDAELFCKYYGITPDGNALSDPQQEFVRQNVLYITDRTLSDTDRATVERSRKILFPIREQKPAPHLDDKILTDWNGLMISAFASAGLILGDKKYTDAALKAALFIEAKLIARDGSLLHRYRDNDAAITATLNDHAFLLHGYLRLYEATTDMKWLRNANRLADQMLERFYDKNVGGFYLTAHDAEKLIARTKELYDGALPSGNSVAVLALLRLGSMLGDRRYTEAAQLTLDHFSGALASDPTNYPEMLMALDYAIGPSREVVLAYQKDDAEAMTMRQEIFKYFTPNQVVLYHVEGRKESLDSISSFVKDKQAVSGRAAAYICHNFTCQLPVVGLDGLKKGKHNDA